MARLGVFVSMILIMVGQCARRLNLKTDPLARNDSIYVIAHGINLESTAKWALKQGVNAIEMDLNFQHSNSMFFHHGTPCDCTCSLFPSSNNICSLEEKVCKGSTNAETLLTYLADKSLALIYIDSKLATASGDLHQTGVNVGKLLTDSLFDLGYNGTVIMGCPDLGGIDYLKGVVSWISSSKYEGRVAYSIDMEQNKQTKVLNALIDLSPYRAYNVGITVCLPFSYYDQIKFASANYAAGVLSMPPGIWTLDKETSMEKYVDFGARMLMTNIPETAIKIAKKKGFKLAQPGDFIRKCTKNEVVTTS